MPPTNDNFANAFPLDPNGSLVPVNSNAGATSEAGEPQSNGKTVWFSFTLPASATGAVYFFSTTNNPLAQPLRTVLQAFTGAAVNALTEVNYAAPFKTAYGGWDFGSLIAFNATPGVTYYIRVDGIPGPIGGTGHNGQEGAFPLRYGPYYRIRLGGCSNCESITNLGYACAGLTANNYDWTSILKQPLSVGFGASNYPRGKYVVRYCAGASTQNITGLGGTGQGTTFFVSYLVPYQFGAAGFTSVQWLAYFNSSSPANPPQGTPSTQRSRSSNIATLTVPAHGLTSGNHVSITGLGGVGYNIQNVTVQVIDPSHFSYVSMGSNEALTADAGGTITAIDSATLFNLPGFGTEFGSQFPTLLAAENANGCVYTRFDHVGGGIQMGLSLHFDSLGPPLGMGNTLPNPSWGLYVINPAIFLSDPPVCASWTSPPSGGGSGTAQVTFNVSNLNDVDWDLVTATLQGVSSPSTLSFQTLKSQTVTPLTLTFTASNENVTATLVLNSPFWTKPFTFTVFLGPIIPPIVLNGPYRDPSNQPGGCPPSGYTIYDVRFAITNKGYWQILAAQCSVVATITNGVMMGPILSQPIFDPKTGITSFITRCPTSSAPYTVPVPGLGIPCSGQAADPSEPNGTSGSMFIALLAPASATAPINIALTITIVAPSGLTLIQETFNITVPL